MKAALVAAFAALYLILSILPGIPAVGFPAIKIELEAALASVMGVILGPYLGGLAALLGTTLAFVFPPGAGIFGLPFIFNPAFNALVTGLIFKGRWKAALAIFAAVVASFFVSPVPNPLAQYWRVGLAATFDKIAALLLILPAAVLLARRSSVESEAKPLTLSLGLLLLLAFIGNEADNALGVALFAMPPIYSGIYGLNLEAVRGLFLVSPFVYPAIRALQAVAAALIGLPLLKAVRALRR